MPVNADSVTGKVILLAGATGQLGSALARHLLDRGARLGIAVRKPYEVDKVAQSLGRERVLVGAVGAQDGEAAAGFCKGVKDALGPIDAFLCTAGMFRAGPVGRDPAPELAELLEANLLTPRNLARAVVPPMLRRRTGSLVFVGAAAVGGPAGEGMVNYLASKAALHEWVRALAAEVRDQGLRVAAVLPTVIDTPANRAAMPEADVSKWQRVEQVIARMVECAFGQPAGDGPLYRVSPVSPVSPQP